MRTLRWTALALVGVLAASVAVPARAQNVEIKPTSKAKHDKYVLTAEEIAERNDITNAYDAVKLLRPNFLKQTRSKGMLGGGAAGGYRPPTKAWEKPPGGDGGSASTGGSSPASPDPYKPDPSTSSGTDQGTTSPFGSSSGGTYVSAIVYIDDIKQPGVDDLKSVRAGEVKEIRYLTGTEASGRYGQGHEGGAILVKTNRGG
jgi:hypothetical protein